MKLFPGGDLESASPVMAIRWCLEPKDIAFIREVSAENPCILFVIVNKNGGESRQLAPLDQMIEYLQFNQPDLHRVFAQIVWSPDGGFKMLKKQLLRKVNHRTYDLKMIDPDDEFIDHYESRSSGFTEIQVVVPKEHFPKEPPAWVKRIVEWGYSFPAIDQCQFRRRFLMAPIKLFFAGIWAIITTVIRCILAFGAGGFLTLRDVNYAPLIHPWSYDMSDVIDTSKVDIWDSWLFYRKVNGSREWRGGGFLFLHPPLYGSLACVIYGVASNRHIGFFAALVFSAKAVMNLLWSNRILEGYLAGSLVAMVVVRFLFAAATAKKEPVNPEEVERLNSLARQQAELARQERHRRLYALLACGSTPPTPEISGIPAEKQTFRLRFLDFKSKVCRPYAN